MEADADTRGNTGAARPLRPLVWLAAALGLGTLGGLEASEARGLAWASALAVALAASWLVRRRRAPPWAVVVLALAFGRALGLDRAPASAAPARAVAARSLRARPVIGVWHTERDGRTGWVEPFAGAERIAGHALLFEPECALPADGTPVAILPGSECTPWARGPAAPPRARAQRFAALAPVAPDELVRLAPAGEGWASPLFAGPLSLLAALREGLGGRAAAVESERSAGLMRALATGDRGGLPPERVDLFARTGTSHLLAISGWHVSLFAALVLRPLARLLALRRRRARWLLLPGVLLLAFAAVTGAEKPILRATLAIVLLLCGERLPLGASSPPRRPDGLSFLAAAFALECLLDPGGIRSLSLALTYAATLGLILGTGALGQRIRGWRADGRAEFRGPLRRAAARCVTLFASGLAASVAAVLATLPITWSTFGELAPAGALLTVLVLPPFAFLSLLAWLAALAPWSGWVPLADLGARALYGLLELGDGLPGTPLLLPPRPFALLVAATLLTFLGLHRSAMLRRAALLWGALLLPWSAAAAELELALLDVGHGTALVLRAPGLEALVFDAGSRDRRGVASEALLPLLARWEVASPWVLLSHPDLDHASGLARLAERLPLGAWLGAGPAQGKVRLAHSTPRFDLESGALRWPWGAAELSLALLRPSHEEGNEGSRALLVTWREDRLLFLGDAEESGLAGLALEPGPVRLLLAPHHGSDAAALWSLLARVPPEEVWISGSADPPIARELDRRGIPWRWTGRDGPLALRLP